MYKYNINLYRELLRNQKYSGDHEWMLVRWNIYDTLFCLEVTMIIMLSVYIKYYGQKSQANLVLIPSL